MSIPKHKDRLRPRLVVVLMDGLSERELFMAAQLPNFRNLLERGTDFGTLRSVYPTLNGIACATLMTGRFPGDHGIVDKHPFQPGAPSAGQRLFWDASELRTPSLFDLAGESGLTSAAVLWPLAPGGHITWNFPGESQTHEKGLSCSPGFSLNLERKFNQYRRGCEQPYLDDYASRCAAFTIRSRKPNLLFTNLKALDDAKRLAGSDSPECRMAMKSLDTSLGHIQEAIEETGQQHLTTLVVMGDHGRIDIDRRVRLNRLLQAVGLCGQVEGEFRWRAWFQCSGGSAFLHIKKGDTSAAMEARALLDDARRDPEIGIREVHEGEKLRALSCGTGAFLAVDAQPGVQFVEDTDGRFIEHAPAHGAFGADQGYHPDLPGYRSLFMAAGPGIIQGSKPEVSRIEDVAPMLAKALGLSFSSTQEFMVPSAQQYRKAVYA